MIHPDFRSSRSGSAASEADIGLSENSISPATPARAALCDAAWIAPLSRSDPVIRREELRPSSLALVTVSSQSDLSKDFQAMNWKLRPSPGAIRRPSNAASIGIVPDPHIGSTNEIGRAHV